MQIHKKEEEFIALLERNWRLMYNVCLHYVGGDTNSVDDLLQDLRIQLWEIYANYRAVWFRGESKESSWIFKVACSVGSKYRARQKRSVPHAQIGDLPEDSGDDGASAFYESPEQDVTEIMYNLINRLSDRDRATILLYIGGCSHTEIAQRTGTTTTNVGTRIMRIKKKLKQLYIKHYGKQQQT